ncbi:ABC transporter permease [Candidatus Kaiserbacteria bacterium]|nr:ABC transporter permease [Candidatus Kaiserbacteria bacterium]
MNFSPAYAIFLRYWYLLVSTPQRFVQIFIWSTFDIVLWGFVTKYLGTFGISGFNFTALLLGSLIFWQFITRIQQGFIMVFLEDSWTRNFINIFASPMTIVEYLSGIVASSLATSAMAIIFGAVVASLLFGLWFPPFVVPFLVFAVILSLFAITLGMISSAIVLRLGPTAEWFAWPIPAVIQPIVGVFYPVSVLPAWAQTIAKLMPPSYIFENLRAVLAGREILWGDLGIAFALSAVYIACAAFLFARTYSWALRTGAISRFGSESF